MQTVKPEVVINVVAIVLDWLRPISTISGNVCESILLIVVQNGIEFSICVKDVGVGAHILARKLMNLLDEFLVVV